MFSTHDMYRIMIFYQKKIIVIKLDSGVDPAKESSSES
jgi:hypothetical protein